MLHADHLPVAHRGQLLHLLSAGIVSVFTFAIIVTEEQLQRSVEARLAVPQHVQIAIGIPAGQNGLAADVQLDVDRLARAIADRVNQAGFAK